MIFFVPDNAMGCIRPIQLPETTAAKPLPRLCIQKQLVIQMKLITAFLLLTVMHVSAGSFSQTVTLHVKEMPLKQVVKMISDQTGYAFLVNPELFDKAAPVTFSGKDVPLSGALRIITKDRGLNYAIKYNTIVLTPASGVTISTRDSIPEVAGFIPAPATELHGRIVDRYGKPVANASVKMKGAKKATLSNDEGFFTLKEVDPDGVLVVSSINIETMELPLSGNTGFITVMVKMKVAELAEVAILVNTGFQTLSKERATGSFGKPDMEIVSKRTGSMDLLARLEGQIAGLQIAVGPNNYSGSTNGNGITTRRSLIRGTSSLELTKEPLYVVNGVVVSDFASINVDDVEDITVLKDAAAAAIWGARAANGVVVVTTKSGSKANRLQVSYNGFINYTGKPDFSYGRVMNSRQFIQAAKDIFDPIVNPYNTVNYSALAPHEQIQYNQYRGLISEQTATRQLDSLADIDNMGQITDLFFRPAISQNHTVSVSGGNSVYSVYGSFGYTGTQSAAIGEKSNAYKLNLTQNLNVGNRLRMTVSASLINMIISSKNNPSVSPSFLPYQLFTDAAGNPININYIVGYPDSVRQDYQARSRINLDYSPLNEIDLGYGKQNNININVTANIGLKLWKGISFSGTYGYQKTPGTAEYYTDNKTIGQRRQLVSFTEAPTVDATPFYHLPLNGGTYTDGHNEQRNFTVRNQLVYDANLRQGEDHITVQAGSDIQESYTMASASTLVGYDEALGTYAVLDYNRLRSGVFGTVSGSGFLWVTPYQIRKEKTRFLSYFALASYNISGKYSVDASWRQDYSNAFGKDLTSQNKPTWSFGAKWRLFRESFLKNVSWLNDLGLRVTYGITGNSPYTGAAARNNVYGAVNSSNSSFGSNMIAGDAFILARVANNKLAWEATHTVNIGVDFSVLDKRLGGAVDVYRKYTTDLIGTIRLNPFSGQTSVTGNIGELLNKGIEVTLRSGNIRGKSFSWSTSLTFSYNHSKLLSYSNPSEWQNTAAAWVGYPPYLVGYSTSPLFAWRYAGLDDMGDPLIFKADKSVTKSPQGADLTTADVAFMGNTTPPFYGGFSNNFRYKNISLTLNAVYSMGGVMRKDVNGMYTGRLQTSNAFSGPNIQYYFADRWKQPGDEMSTDIPSYVADGYTNYTRRNTAYYTNGDINVVSSSFIKLRDITLNYEFSDKLVRSLKIQNAGIFVQATNFRVWTANKDGIDPEIPRYAGTGHPGHSYSVGVNLSF